MAFPVLKRLLWLVLFLAVVAAVAVFAGLRSYRAFTQEELVATVECLPAAPGSDRPFVLKVSQVRGGVPAPAESFPIHGRQWALGGDILKWAPWLTALGARPVHKLTRLESRWLTAAEEVNGPRSAYDLNGGSAPIWRWLHAFGATLPLVDAVYGSTAYTDARPGGRWGVYVTHDSYLIRVL